MMRLEESIPIVLCKLERIFPPSLFGSMEHLQIHLPYEARIAGPVQYRWMYPFQRYCRRLINNMQIKARIEGTIRNAYLVKEATIFCSHYFDEKVKTRQRRTPQNYDDGEQPDLYGNWSIFKYTGRSLGQVKKRLLQNEEYIAAHTYVLLNCSEVDRYLVKYKEEIRAANPVITEVEIDKKLDESFAGWFLTYGQNNHIKNKFIKDLSKGPIRTARTFNTYYCNGYKFQTMDEGAQSSTVNSGVCVKGSNYRLGSEDYYGRLVEIVELEYPTLPIKRTVLFNCDWFDPTRNVGTKYNSSYDLVDVHSRKRLRKYEPFIFAHQAVQVCYLSYPSNSRQWGDWLAVCKVKARSVITTPDIDPYESLKGQALQEDEDAGHMIPFVSAPVEDSGPLSDPMGEMVELDDPNSREGEEDSDDFCSVDYNTDGDDNQHEPLSDSDIE